MPEAPRLVRADALAAMVRDAVRESSVDIAARRRALLAGGETAAALRAYNDAVARARAALRGASLLVRLTREAAAVIRTDPEAENPDLVREELETIERDLRVSTDATVRADLIRRAWDHRAREERARRAAEELAARPVTDLLLDEASWAAVRELSLVAAGKALPAREAETGAGADEGSAESVRYHEHPDPLRWYD